MSQDGDAHSHTHQIFEVLYTNALADNNCAKRSLRSEWQFGPLQILFSSSSFADYNHFLRGGSEGVDRPGAPWWFDA